MKLRDNSQFAIALAVLVFSFGFAYEENHGRVKSNIRLTTVFLKSSKIPSKRAKKSQKRTKNSKIKTIKVKKEKSTKSSKTSKSKKNKTTNELTKSKKSKGKKGKKSTKSKTSKLKKSKKGDCIINPNAIDRITKSISGINVDRKFQRKAIQWVIKNDPPLNDCNGDNDITQKYVLSLLYYSTSGDNWERKDNWLSQNINECSWHGIECENGNVVKIKLPTNNLSGNLPSELSAIHTVRNLEFYLNKLRGRLPKQIFNLPLDIFDIEGNQLSGQIFPVELFKINGAGNTLSKFLVSRNNFTGEIPTMIGQLTQLTDFYVADNRLNGRIPEQLGMLSNLENLYLYENNFSGGLPPDLFTLPKLQKLSVYGNSLMGGHLPTKILSLGLQTLDVEDSGIIGRIPENIGSLFSLEALYLGGNDLTGSIPNLKRLTKLAVLDFHNNELTGTIPALSDSSKLLLKKIDLSFNKLDGTIPPNLFEIPELEFLYLNNNILSGSIPTWDSISKLKDIFLNRNRLIGSIPDISSMLFLSNITKILINDNCLTGPVPPGICTKRQKSPNVFKTFHVDCKPLLGKDKIIMNKCEANCCTECFRGNPDCST